MSNECDKIMLALNYLALVRQHLDYAALLWSHYNRMNRFVKINTEKCAKRKGC